MEAQPLQVTASYSYEETKKRPTVAVIGCGPGGMFFLHAIATRRRTMEEAGDVKGLERLPDVTVFERSSSPGGVWKTDREFKDYGTGKKKKSDCANMYEALWTNGAKENFEFFDYTFEEHFGVALPAYMPRQLVLEYFMARVTRKNPNFFDNVYFDTTVVSVKYDDTISKFIVVTRDNHSQLFASVEYDKCIWAAGENGRPNIPNAIECLLKSGSFLGKRIHSSNVGNFKEDVQGKRIILIGDAYSAEDLALQAIKLGVERIYIISRSGLGVASYMSEWPHDKVEVISEVMPSSVIQGGHGIQFKGLEYNCELDKHEIDEDGDTINLLDISTVVYCTGYECNIRMLDEDLRKPLTNYTPYTALPSDWKMKPNMFSELYGDIVPYPSLSCSAQNVQLEIYRYLLISNPNMMYMQQFGDSPLFEADTSSWLLLGYITGDVEIPSPEVMRKLNEKDILEMMDIHSMRERLDANYAEASDITLEDEEGKEHWSTNILDQRILAYEKEGEKYSLRCNARDMKNSSYPVDIGSFEKLNRKGEQYLINSQVTWINRLNLQKGKYTFRDGDSSKIQSIFTDQVAVPLRKLWLDLKESDYNDLVGKGEMLDNGSRVGLPQVSPTDGMAVPSTVKGKTSESAHRGSAGHGWTVVARKERRTRNQRKLKIEKTTE